MDLAAILGVFDPARHKAEANKRWGDTGAYKESARRASGYTPEDRKRYRTEDDAVMREAAAAMASGHAAEGEDAMAIAERHRLSIDRWFYPCSKAMHAGLADLYEADPRFAANIDAYGENLTAWWAAAIRANAAR